MEKNGDQYVIETGGELLVAVATHEGGAFSLIGTFTEMRLALIGSEAFTDEYDGEHGTVVATEVYATCLNQHGTCPALVGGTLHPEAKLHAPKTAASLAAARERGLPVRHVDARPLPEDMMGLPITARFGDKGSSSTKEQVLACKMLWIGPILTKDHFMDALDYSIISGLVDGMEFRGDVDTLVWDLFGIEGCTMGDHERAMEVTGLPVCVKEDPVTSKATPSSSRTLTRRRGLVLASSSTTSPSPGTTASASSSSTDPRDHAGSPTSSRTWNYGSAAFKGRPRRAGGSAGTWPPFPPYIGA